MQFNRKVILLLGWLEIGGAERQALVLAEGLKQRGRMPEVWGISAPGRVMQECERMGIPSRHVPVKVGCHPRFLFGLTRFLKQVQGVNPVAILPFTVGPNTITGLVHPFLRLRTCVWNQWDCGAVLASFPLEKLAIARSSQVISNSAAGAACVSRRYGIERSRIRIVRNSIKPGNPIGGAEVRARVGLP